jgi:hypothetical protein
MMVVVCRYNQVASVLESILDVNMKMGLQGLEGTPLQLARIDPPSSASSESQNPPSSPQEPEDTPSEGTSS